MTKIFVKNIFMIFVTKIFVNKLEGAPENPLSRGYLLETRRHQHLKINNPKLSPIYYGGQDLDQSKFQATLTKILAYAAQGS